MQPDPSAGKAPRGEALELVIFAGDAVLAHPLPPSGRVTIGRAEGNDVRIDHPSVSRRHAVLHLGPGLSVEDLGSANGTSLRDSRRTPEDGSTQGLIQIAAWKREVTPGDTLTFGSVMTVIRRAAPPDEPLPEGDGLAPGVVVHHPAMRALYAQATLAARSYLSVLVLGETGVGKEVLTRAVHQRSPRAKKPFVGLNCAALSESLLESELFGHEKGAFTGALQAQPGLFEAADGGTVFLDEVGELPMTMQVKLLRVLEERQVLRVGGRNPRPVDVRFIAATNRDLEAEAARGAFRQDLFFRLNGITLTIPPLRERAEEIAALARTFVERACAQLDRPRVPALSGEALAQLERYAWPGNIRELRNTIERAVVLCPGETLRPEHLPSRLQASGVKAPMAITSEVAPPSSLPAPPSRPAAARADERERIIAALEACAGNQTQAAARLGISRQTLIAKIEAYGLPRPRKRT
ncbi:sigma 54-interacting transcriptional regulator [Polyangium jinanense]|uniref:Sigma 54-interacting transcriptional regulator n=1 Tax=Polyangium jinanense TaxID=2829994 RepID=A0A9X3X946_9BACT|nr:sigma 54-interacting transcriptional regulator [Polyangium jinanense]MDC3985045.1 sigma 54-interacting transcriptional regulator [Polyangium jinanense]